MNKIDGLKDELTKKVKEKYPKAVLKFVDIDNNNGQGYEGIYLRLSEQDRIVPIIPVKRFWKGYCTYELSVDDILKEIIDIVQNPEIEIRIPDIEEYKHIKGKLSMKLINEEMNRERLSKLPYIPYLDMAIIFVVEFYKKENEKLVYTVTWKNLEEWGVTIGEVYQNAYQNLINSNQIRIFSLYEVITQRDPMMGEAVKELIKDSRICVLSNKSNCNGAVGILFKEKLQEYAVMVGNEDFYIVPSSIHELILLPKCIGEVEEILQMVKEVNNSNVSLEEILSYHIYKYEYDKERILDLCA